MLRFLITPIVLFVTSTAHAQFGSSATSAASEDIVELSPFVISGSELGRARPLGSVSVPTPLVDPRSASTPASAAVSVFKRADAVAIQFVLSHTGDKQETRNQELYASVMAVESAIKELPGIKVEQREVRFTGGDRGIFSVSRGGSTTSFASLLVLAELSPGARIADRVKEVRGVLSTTKLVGQSKYSDGSVGLYIKNPDQYRREILQKIFDDFEFIKKGFGDEFEILPSGLSGKVRIRVASEAELELWIDYGFTFRSVREIDGKKR